MQEQHLGHEIRSRNFTFQVHAVWQACRNCGSPRPFSWHRLLTLLSSSARFTSAWHVVLGTTVSKWVKHCWQEGKRTTGHSTSTASFYTMRWILFLKTRWWSPGVQCSNTTKKQLHRTPDKNGILDVDISYDASWMTREYKSHTLVSASLSK